MLSPESLAPVKAFYYSLLPDMEAQSWERCAALMTLRHIPKGGFLLKPGQVCNHVSFINRGLTKLYYLEDGREIIMDFFTENCYVTDYASFLTRKPSGQYIEALEDTEVVELDYEGVQAIYDTVPEGNRIGRYIAEELFILLVQWLGEIKSLTPEQRYERLSIDRPELLQRAPQYMIASFLGITPEALSRIRARRGKRTVAAAGN